MYLCAHGDLIISGETLLYSRGRKDFKIILVLNQRWPFYIYYFPRNVHRRQNLNIFTAVGTVVFGTFFFFFWDGGKRRYYFRYNVKLSIFFFSTTRFFKCFCCHPPSHSLRLCTLRLISQSLVSPSCQVMGDGRVGG